MSDSVNQDDLAKALAALSDIAKGHSSRGTATTQVESMRDGSKGAGSSSGATQVAHTAQNSDPKGWAGSSAKMVSEDGATDHVAENGTDYQAQSQGAMMKSIIEKMAKGLPLSSKEAELYASIAKGKLPDFMKEDKKEDKKDDDKDKAEKAVDLDDEDDDEDKKMDKSLSDYAEEDESVSKGLEVSEFLAGFANVIAKSLESMEERIVAKVLKSQAAEAEATGEFQKSLAVAVSSLGEALAATAQRVDQVESQPARGARTVQQVHALEKGGFGAPQGPELTKSLVAATLLDLVAKNEASVHDVINFDSNGTLSPNVEQKVRAAVGAGR